MKNWPGSRQPFLMRFFSFGRFIWIKSFSKNRLRKAFVLHIKKLRKVPRKITWSRWLRENQDLDPFLLMDFLAVFCKMSTSLDKIYIKKPFVNINRSSCRKVGKDVIFFAFSRCAERRALRKLESDFWLVDMYAECFMKGISIHALRLPSKNFVGEGCISLLSILYFP